MAVANSPEIELFEYASNQPFQILAIALVFFWLTMFGLGVMPKSLSARFIRWLTPHLIDRPRRIAAIGDVVGVLYVQVLFGWLYLQTHWRFLPRCVGILCTLPPSDNSMACAGYFNLVVFAVSLVSITIGGFSLQGMCLRELIHFALDFEVPPEKCARCAGTQPLEHKKMI
jgi:hypothetical protein